MPKNVENFEIRTLGRDDYAQAAVDPFLNSVRKKE